MWDYSVKGALRVWLAEQSILRYTGISLLLFAIFFSFQAKAQIKFQDKTSTAGPFHTGESWGASWGHLNNDIYPDLYVSNHGMPTAIYKNNGNGTFSNVTAAATPDGQLAGTDRDRKADIHGGTWADIDNDGDDDLFVTRSNEGARVHLFENNGNGVFRDVGSAKGVAPLGTARLAMVYDYDKDGKLDVSVGRRGVPLDVFKGGTTRFTKVTSTVGIEGECEKNGYGVPAHLFDPDKLIYNCMSAFGFPEHSWDTSTTPWTEVTSAIDRVGTFNDTAVIDLNNDGLQDMVSIPGRRIPSGAKRISSSRIEAWLSVENRTERSFKFKATGPITINLYSRYIGTRNKDTNSPNLNKYDEVYIGSSNSTPFPSSLPFTLNPNNTAHHGIRTRQGRGAYVGYDPTAQEWTLYISSKPSGGNAHVYITINGTGLTNPTDISGLSGADGPLQPVVLFNNGSRLVKSGGRGMPSLMCGAVAAADFDNDMDVDLYLVCRTGLENLENRFYWNNGSGSFTLGANHGAEGPVGAGVLGGDGTGEMAVTADYNVDGFMDLFVTNGNRLFPHFVKDKFTGGGPDKIYRNRADNGNRWLMFDLQGVQSNRSGFGAQITVTAGGKTQFREQHGSYHRWSHDHRRVHFGMGSNNRATVTIKWPNGATDVHTNVATNKLYKAIENGNLQVLNTGGGSTPVLSVDSDSVLEGNSASLTVTLSSSSSSTVRVDYRTVNASATAGSDYTAKSGTLTFSPGQTSKSITLNTLEDTTSEANETFDLQLRNATNASIGQSTGVVTIRDDDGGGGGGPAISVGDLTVNEGGAAVFAISLASSSSKTVTVSYQTVNGTARSGSDYTARSGSVVFQPGDTLKTRTVMTIQDNQSEPSETFSMGLSNPVNGTLGQSSGTVTINDDDGGGQGIFCGQPTINTSVDRAIFLWKDCADTGKWRVRATAGGGSAIRYSGNISTNRSISGVTPYSIESSDTLNSNASRITFGMETVNVWQDGFDFNVGTGTTCFNLNAPSGINVLIGASRTPVTPSFNIETLQSCQTGGGGPTLSIADLTTVEGGSAVFRISLSSAASNTVTVNFQTNNGTAKSGTDYAARSGKVIFSPGDTVKTRTVTTVQDNLAESNENFNMTLTNAVNASLGQSTGTATINDDDGGGQGIFCGEPTINTSSHRQIFLWKDCDGDGKWHVIATAGGGSNKTYAGNLSTNRSFSGVSPFSIEASDSLTSTSKKITFNMTVGSTWRDGFDFDVATGKTCMTLSSPDGERVRVGASRTAVTPPFDIETLGNCQ